MSVLCGQPTPTGPCRRPVGAHGAPCGVTHPGPPASPAAVPSAAPAGPPPDPLTVPAVAAPVELAPVDWDQIGRADNQAIGFLSGSPGIPARYTDTHETRSAAKRRAVTKICGRLTDRLASDPALAAWAARPAGRLEQRVKEVISGWANSAIDDPDSLAMQLAVRERFGAGDETLTRVMARSDTTLDDDPDAVLYRALADEMYHQAQEELAAAGIETLTLHRGMSFDAHDAPAWAAGWAADAQDATDVDPGSGVVVDGVDRLPTRSLPLSSWSADPDEAWRFSRCYGRQISVVFTAQVPAAAVFSFPGAGLGCGPESELVVLGVGGAVSVSWEAQTDR